MSMDMENMSPRHKLNQEWVWWFDCQDKKYTNNDNWSDCLQKLGTVSDIEVFWSTLKEIGDLCVLPISSNLHFFRTGIEPMWEDPRNASGGKWVLELSFGTNPNQIWANTLLFCLSESVMVRSADGVLKDSMVSEAAIDKSYSNAICGAVFSPRKNYVRISIWTSIKDKKVMRIGELWRAFAEIPESSKLIFKAHENALKGSRDSSTDVFSL
ncbi:translation initiation factor 4E [Nematocida sp. ERTm5]|nr:translation initiation factor 4E [Nematocida sp. AWRm79]KAI5183752.1 translation initiation factor 4E [Nematocida sp. AWRm78]OAG29154.1 translation initiation factor 4E [Nematocida sp. ERTm5]